VTPPFRKTARRLWQAGSGDAGPRIEVKTVSGDLSAGISATERPFVPASPAPVGEDLLIAPPAPPAPMAPPAPPAPPAPMAPPSPAAPLSESRAHDQIDADSPEAGMASPQPVAQGEAVRLAVLEAVERGEIDVEEALRRLEAVDSSTSP
jgi:hypothetical protein